ncbi:MAG: ABC-F family ATP-binding cassette domain-containing protein [Planctomycetia bacterium]|nr:ABC-F family ATP-binding cassette domain-containing protein [Planctomycetia bacterium]
MSLLLSAQKISKGFGPRPLFSDLSVDLHEGARLGLIGPNGSGKSTLLKVLLGSEPHDEGTRSLKRGTRLGYLAQDDVFPAGKTVLEVVVAALSDEPSEDYEKETQAAITLTQTGFTDTSVQASTLSGGWRKRLSLACQLVKKPDFLLLDEPTNHLDLSSIVWLERLLRDAPFGYLAASHDRAFLRAVADEIIEINRVYPGGAFRFAAGYDEFVDRRDEFLETQARQQESVANQVRRETEWLGRKAAARTRKASSRIEDAYARREELAELKYRTAQAGSAGIDFADTGRQTRKLLAASGLTHALGGKQLFQNVDLLLSPGTKLGLLGANGSGKSTLLKVLAGLITPDAGTIQRADKLRTVMFEQGRSALQTDQSLKQALGGGNDIVIYRDRPIHVVSWANRFLFQSDRLEISVGALSGGEQARVRIAQLMLQPADVLLLDEPTNDLDIPALEVLEESLSEFPGAVVLVSHDRDLMDRLCTEVIGLDGDGNAGSYANVGQWITSYDKAQTEKQKKETVAAAPAKRTVTESKPKKLSFKEQQEWNQMEEAIAAAEAKLTECHAAVEAASTAGHLALTEACHAMEAAQQEVDRLYHRWQELELKRGNS